MMNEREQIRGVSDMRTDPRGSEPAPTVAYIMSRFPKLTETFVLYEILAMESAGLSVKVYPLLRCNESVRHPEAEAWAQRARYLPFVSLQILAAVLFFLVRRPRKTVAAMVEALYGTHTSRNFLIGAIGILPKSFRFAYEMERAGVNHIHAHFATHPALSALIVHRLTGIPFSFTAHGSDLHVDRTMLGSKVNAAAFTVTISDYNRRLIIDECGRGTADRVHVVHCGVDSRLFHPGSGSRSAGPLRLICVASFEEVKGHRYLIEACQILVHRGIDFQLDLIGAGPLQQEMEILAEAVSDRVQFLGPRSRPEVAELLRAADVAILASYQTPQGKREGIPVALMEAMASGLPVVASAVSGIPELVVDGSTGILAEPRNPTALADAIELLAGDPGLRIRMGRSGRERVQREFNLETSALQLIGLIRGEHRVETPPVGLPSAHRIELESRETSTLERVT